MLTMRDDPFDFSAQVIQRVKSAVSAGANGLMAALALAVSYSELGRNEDALEVLVGTVEILRKKAHTAGADEMHMLADLLEHTAWLLQDDWNVKAHQAFKEAMKLRRHLTRRRSNDDELALNKSLLSYASFLMAWNETTDAIRMVRESIGVCRRLQEKANVDCRSSLARGLNILSDCLLVQNKLEEALTQISRAIEIGREISERGETEGFALLGDSLNIRGLILARMEQLELSLESSYAGLQIRRTLVSEYGGQYWMPLGESLWDTGARLSALRRSKEALKLGREAIDVYRRALMRSRSTKALEGLAGASSNVGGALIVLGNYKDARAFLAEALEIRRVLAAEVPFKYNPVLAEVLLNWGSCLSNLGLVERSAAAYSEAISLYRGLSGTPFAKSYSGHLGIALLGFAQQLASPEDLDAALVAAKEALAILERASNTQPVSYGSHLAHAYQLVENTLDALGRHSEAELIRIGALRKTPSGIGPLHVSYPPEGRKDFERSRQDRWHSWLAPQHKKIIAAPTAYPNRGNMLAILAKRGDPVSTLSTLFSDKAAEPDLNDAISAMRGTAAGMAPNHPDRAGFLSNLACALLVRFRESASDEDLDEAVTLGRTAVRVAPMDHPDRVQCLVNLSVFLLTRYRQAGSFDDLEKAIEAKRQVIGAVLDADPERGSHLAHLSAVLVVRFDLTGRAEDLDEAISLGREAVGSAPHRVEAGWLSILCAALRTRYEQSGNASDIEEAITFGRDAVAITPRGHPDRAQSLTNLSNALRIRFRQTGTIRDLNDAVNLGRKAVAARTADDLDRSISLTILAAALSARYEQTGGIQDLNEAVDLARSAVADDDLNLPACLSNLGTSLMKRYKRTGSVADLDEAIVVLRNSVARTLGGHPHRAAYLSNLGVTLHDRYELNGNLADLDEMIAAQREAVDATPANHPLRAAYLSNLGVALYKRYELNGNLADLDEMITAQREAVDAIPPNHPVRTMVLLNLGTFLHARYEQTSSRADLTAAVSAFLDAADCETAAPSLRVQVAVAGAQRCHTSDLGAAAALFQKAVRLLPDTVSRELARQDQQHFLEKFSALAGEAAAFSLDAHDAGIQGPGEVPSPATALASLEFGRAVLLSQALATRSDLTDLRTQHPHLARRYIALRDELDMEEPEHAPSLASPISPLAVAKAVAVDFRDRYTVAAEFDAIVAEIRQLEDFRHFMLPPDPSDLIHQASDGPIVAFNVTRYRCDALLIHPAGITNVRLPNLTLDDLMDKINIFHQALRDCADLGLTATARKDAQQVVSGILGWLWDVAAEPVLDKLGYQGPPDPGAPWPRVWWAPGGALGLLPIHAAGHHRAGPVGDCRTVVDRAISSYTPTVRALAHARERDSLPSMETSALIVSMPTTPGLEPLPNSLREVTSLAQRVLRATLLTESQATKKSVLKHLPSHSISHFACHGETNLKDPSQSRLLLFDHRSDPLTVLSLAPVKLDKARLAYLSACRTTINFDVGLIDEAIHMAGAFQLVGFPHVIATLWEIDDGIAARVADEFYAGLLSGNAVDPKRSARALQQAWRRLRDEYTQAPSLWAGFIHAGA